jgi:hypothetical protein
MTDEEKVKAMRLARAIASDISLYNEQKILKALEADNFYDALKDEIEEGRELFKQRSPGSPNTSSYSAHITTSITARPRKVCMTCSEYCLPKQIEGDILTPGRHPEQPDTNIIFINPLLSV